MAAGLPAPDDGGLFGPPSQVPAEPATQPKILEKIIVWDVDGNPKPATRPVLAKKQVSDLIPTAASLPYDGDDPRFKDRGMSNIEVASIRQAKAAADGDQDALKDMRDRMLGKPKQSVEKLTVNMTYEDMLKKLAEEDSATSPTPDEPIDVTPEPEDLL